MRPLAAITTVLLAAGGAVGVAVGLAGAMPILAYAVCIVGGALGLGLLVYASFAGISLLVYRWGLVTVMREEQRARRYLAAYEAETRRRQVEAAGQVRVVQLIDLQEQRR